MKILLLNCLLIIEINKTTAISITIKNNRPIETTIPQQDSIVFIMATKQLCTNGIKYSLTVFKINLFALQQSYR